MTDNLPINADGIWEELTPHASSQAGLAGAGQALRAALFLDRDGVLNEEVGYLGDPEELCMIDGSANLVAAANRLGVPVVVVTNQGGIGRGALTWSSFGRVQRRLLEQLAARGAVPDMVLACPFHEEADPPYRHPDHPDRKPRPGMLLRAAGRLGLDLSRSWIVGDSARDMKAGHAAGLAGGVLVATGHGMTERGYLADWEPDAFCYRELDSLADCLSLLGLLRGR